jgi:hypothetical protein
MSFVYLVTWTRIRMNPYSVLKLDLDPHTINAEDPIHCVY